MSRLRREVRRCPNLNSTRSRFIAGGLGGDSEKRVRFEEHKRLLIIQEPSLLPHVTLEAVIKPVTNFISRKSRTIPCPTLHRLRVIGHIFSISNQNFQCFTITKGFFRYSQASEYMPRMSHKYDWIIFGQPTVQELFDNANCAKILLTWSSHSTIWQVYIIILQRFCNFPLRVSRRLL